MIQTRLYSIGLIAGFLLLLNINGFSQGSRYHCPGFLKPDSLPLVTVSGTAMVDTVRFQVRYFLDEDQDSTADYILNFGPSWYQPDSGNATRPQNGDPITIYGGLCDSTRIGLPVIVVYEINGEFWRDPYAPLWINLGRHFPFGGFHHGGMRGFAFGFLHDSLNVDTLNGTALVDTTFIFKNYFLDTDGDSMPDYYLNFGPPWYQPASGATRPQPGDTVEIVGGVLNKPKLPVVIVFQINGLAWRDTTGFGHHFGGCWIYRDMKQPQWAHSPFDTHNGIWFNPGWHRGGRMMPDKLFLQILELYPQNMPNTAGLNVFAGNEIGVFSPNGMNAMWPAGGGGQMSFASNVKFQLHYNDVQLQGMNIDESTIEARTWDKNTNSWQVVSGAVVDPAHNTVTFSQNSISPYVILTGQENTTTLNDEQRLVADGFLLEQNYPNPFNPETHIDFVLEKNARVQLSVYNILGQKVDVLLNRELNAGNHTVQFDGRNLPSGIYFYQLRVGDHTQVRKMELMK
jgi:hypothetical protein